MSVQKLLWRKGSHTRARTMSIPFRTSGSRLNKSEVCYVRMEYTFAARKESEYRNLMFISLTKCLPNLTHKLFDLQMIKYFYKAEIITITYTSASGFQSIHLSFITQTQPEKHKSLHTRNVFVAT